MSVRVQFGKADRRGLCYGCQREKSVNRFIYWFVFYLLLVSSFNVCQEKLLLLQNKFTQVEVKALNIVFGKITNRLLVARSGPRLILSVRPTLISVSFIYFLKRNTVKANPNPRAFMYAS